MASELAHALLGAPEEQALEKGSEEWKLHQPAEMVDARDLDTPDNWIPRNPQLLRLTGRHPLNCEPTMELLMGSGFITPVSLHLVRNHGAVPKIDWKTHRIEVNGLVERPMSLSMDELVKLPSIMLPVTITCAGNRRKEENTIKKSIGFSWGPCATSCSYWTGVRLCELLKHAQVKGPDQGANFVRFRGPKGELPKGGDGSYGTSISLATAVDPTNDIILAYKHNGRWLSPDHGFPTRLVIPGHIGGRMVKWLSEVTVTKEESNNFYHYHDNKVLPPHVDEQLAKEGGWWYKPDFIINELNINSVVGQPLHDDVVSIKADAPYIVKGYAYSGGGRKVIRVELSFDDGKSWRQAVIQCAEKPSTYGKYWCWVFWDLNVKVSDFLGCEELLVRAWDCSQNGQPAVITWNVMGMMNNCYYKIRIQRHLCENGEIGIRFQHPAPIEMGPLKNLGWCEEDQAKNEALVLVALSKSPTVKPTDEARDATSLLEDHMGDTGSTPNSTETNSETQINHINPSTLNHMSQGYDTCALSTSNSQPKCADSDGANREKIGATKCMPVALNQHQKIPFKLMEKIILSHDTRLLRFALQSPGHMLGLPTGKHMFFYAKINGEPVMRAYTPTSSNDDLGYFDLVVKVYFSKQHPNYPEGGKMSQYFEQMQIGDAVDVKGPVGHFIYEGRGAYIKNRKARTAKKISMIAGGTGITPMYQVIKAVLKDSADNTELSLLYANQTEQDILLRSDLEQLAAHNSNFKIWYTVDRPTDLWQYSTGFVNKKMFEEHLFAPGENSIVLVCGPQPMIDFVCIPNLKDIGFSQDSIVVF